MTTVVDVARRAGVSITTVSRVLAGQDAVAPSTRTKVLTAIEELDFRPNHMAQGLRRGRSRAVAFVVGDIEQNVYPQLSKYVQSAIEVTGLDLLLFNLSHSAERFRAFLNRARTLRLSGIVLATSDILDPGAIKEFQATESPADCPFLVIGQNLSAEGIVSVYHDDAMGSYEATRHLISTAHHKIGYIGRIKGSAIGQARFSGYRRALEEFAGGVDMRRVWDAAYRYPAGYSAMARAMDEGVALDGIITGSDELALGAMAGALDRGIRVPEDLSIFGFGDVEWGAHVRPSLSTLSNDFPAMAGKVRDLIGQAQDEKQIETDNRISRRMILRQSVSPRNAGVMGWQAVNGKTHDH